MRLRARKSTSQNEDEQWISEMAKPDPLENSYINLAHLLSTMSRLVSRKRRYYSELEVLGFYGASDEELDNINFVMLRRIAAPSVMFPILWAILGLINGITSLIDIADLGLWIGRVCATLILVLGLVNTALATATRKRVLVRMKVCLYHLAKVRRHHLLEGAQLDSTAELIRSERWAAKRALRANARTLKRLLAKVADKWPGEPGFEECARLSVWLYWACEDLDDPVRVHRAIRACRQALGHFTGPNYWRVPEVDCPPTLAASVPFSRFPRARSAVARVVQASSIAAGFGVVTAAIGLTAKLL
jgi:hypothetical protein